MPYLNTTTTTIGHTVQAVRAAYPETSIPEGASFGEFIWYAPSDPQPHDPHTHLVVEVAPDDGVQQWRVDAIAPTVPASVTMRQARLALLGAGLLASVDAAIDSLPSPQKEAARIEWEYATDVQRSSGLVPMMGAALSLTEAQLDSLFITATTL